MKGDFIPKDFWMSVEYSTSEKVVLACLFPDAAKAAGYTVCGTFRTEPIYTGDVPNITDVKEKPTPTDTIKNRQFLIGEKPIEKTAIGRPRFMDMKPLSKIQWELTKRSWGTDVERKWCEWVAYRESIKKKLSPYTMKHQIDFLSSQPDPIACIDQSIASGWVNLFPYRGGRNGNQREEIGVGENQGGNAGSGSNERRTGGNDSKGTRKSYCQQVQRKSGKGINEQISVQSLKKC